MSTSEVPKPPDLRAVLIAPDRDLAAQLCRAVLDTPVFQVLADLKKYPDEETLEIRLRQFRAEVVLLDVYSDVETACALIRRLSSTPPPVPVIALDKASRPDVVMRVLKLGAREYLAAPFDPALQRDAAAGIARLHRAETEAGNERGRVIAFASAKPGSGASTLACQTASALRRITGERVLLADLDLAAGTVAYYTAQTLQCSFLDALERAGQSYSAGLAAQASAHWGLDVLNAPDSPGDLPADPARFHQTVELLRGRYDWIVLDLPSILHRVSLLALAVADRTFLVATTQLASLHLARKALQFLGQFGSGRERLEVILNQASHREGMHGQELEKILGGPASALMPDDGARLHQAVALGEPVAADSGFGKAVERLARRVASRAGREKPNISPMLGAGPVFAEV